ncbi:alpha/beta family hydrolase [Catenovulum maritimum]|uniref:KANL3/Tex30 alpha/beta hydrolase-like domain-containing protein n=1 Tax=Catenovulum maritimum TaxID=1513271 RepID=A0A0J8GRD0_9ALTE|nr:alpha/beta family hydrolase [Catenovulum maritimum]KMT65257.1 hypothetical protein XM47_09455 [Catenovulum maritimum]
MNQEQAKAILVLAHGAGAGSQSEFMQQICNKITEISNFEIKVRLFDFPYMQQIAQTGKKRPPDRMPKLLESFQAQVAQLNSNIPVFVAGKSMGARVALQVHNLSDKISGYIALGYPFHPVGKLDKLRLEGLDDFSGRGLIIQGERDSFGNFDQVQTYSLSSDIELCWIEKADHSLKPLKSTGISHDEALNTTAAKIIEFIYANI